MIPTFVCRALKLSLNRQDSDPNTQPSCTSWQAAFIDNVQKFCSDLVEKEACSHLRELASLGHKSEQVLTQKNGESVFLFQGVADRHDCQLFQRVSNFLATFLSFLSEKGISQYMWLVYLEDIITSTIIHDKDTRECTVQRVGIISISWQKLRLHHWHLKFNSQYCKHDE